jgi:hypothetical protein
LLQVAQTHAAGKNISSYAELQNPEKARRWVGAVS